jgi:hypothetical protein
MPALMRRSVAAIAAAAGAAHLLTLSRYGFYRDELYFLACAKRLAWGFVDQPPLIPAIAALALPVDGNIIAVRICCALAAIATILVADRLAAQLGATPLPRVLCAVSVALMPGSLFLGNTLTTTSFEPLTWTIVVALVFLLARTRERRYVVLLCVAIAVAAYMKYSIFLLAVALIAGATAVRDRRTAANVFYASCGALVLLAPNLVWQAAHGFPFAAVLAGDLAGRHAFNAGPQYEFRGILANAPAFALEQFAFTNPLAAPLWIAALLRDRMLAVSYAVLFLAGIVLQAKGYYIVGVYPALFAAGVAAFTQYGRRLQRVALAAVTASGLLLAPLALPLLPVDALVSYMHTFGAPARLMQPLFADEFGWPGLTASVAQAYRETPAPIFADTYGAAAAIEYYGSAYGLPQPISAQNQYYLWGPRGNSLRRILAVGASEYAVLKSVYGSVRLVQTFENPHRWVVEGPTPIYLCTQPRYSDEEIWHRLRWYGA